MDTLSKKEGNNYYPVELKFTVPGDKVNDGAWTYSEEAICVTVNINSSSYNKIQVLEELTLIYQKLLKCFC